MQRILGDQFVGIVKMSDIVSKVSNFGGGGDVFYQGTNVILLVLL